MIEMLGGVDLASEAGLGIVGPDRAGWGVVVSECKVVLECMTASKTLKKSIFRFLIFPKAMAIFSSLVLIVFLIMILS